MAVREMIEYHTLNTVFRIRQSQEPEYLADFLLNDNRNKKIIIPQSNLTLFRNSFLYRGISSWNSLPLDIRTLTDIKHFKSSTKKWITSEQRRFEN